MKSYFKSLLLKFSTQPHLPFRSVVFRPDGDPAAAGEHLRVGEGRGERGAELNELPDGPAAFHHGDLRAAAAALWHPGHNFCVVHHHGAHHVLPVCAQSQEKTPPRHIRSRHGPHIRRFSAPIPLCTCEMNVSPRFPQQTYCSPLLPL